MLATASPLPKSSSPPAPNASLAAAHGSPGDSDFECSDDEPALSVLRDELRTTTESFSSAIPDIPSVLVAAASAAAAVVVTALAKDGGRIPC